MGLIQSVEGPEGETSGSLGKDRCLGLLCRPGRVSRCPAGPRPAPDLGPVRPEFQPPRLSLRLSMSPARFLSPGSPDRYPASQGSRHAAPLRVTAQREVRFHSSGAH